MVINILIFGCISTTMQSNQQAWWLLLLVSSMYISWTDGACSSVVGWGTLIQAERLRVRFRWGFLNWPNPSAHIMALGLAQPLTEMSTRNLPGGKRRPVCKADNLSAICEPIVYKMWEPRHLTTLWPPWPITLIELQVIWWFKVPT
jgi:hypothetical protein